MPSLLMFDPIRDLKKYISFIMALNPQIFQDLNKDTVAELKKNIPEISEADKAKESLSLTKYVEYKIKEFSESRSNSNKNNSDNNCNSNGTGDTNGDTNGNSDENSSRSLTRYFYRGQYDSKVAMKSGVYRGDNQDKEDFYYHEILVRCPDDFKNTTHLEKLAIMQHYGVPTRLLDITANPLAALYFACKNYGCEKCKSCDEGVVHVFQIETDDLSYFDSDRALILSCLPKFKASEKKEILKLAVNNLYKDEFPLDSNGKVYKDSVIERLYHEICSEAPAFTRNIKPIDLLSPLFVQPSKNSKRILRQDGAFIISGLSANTYEEIFKLHVIISHVEIIVRNKNEILKQLDKIGINEATLFPEIDHVATYLKSL